MLANTKKAFILSTSLIAAMTVGAAWGQEASAYVKPNAVNSQKETQIKSSQSQNQTSTVIKRNDRGSNVEKLQIELNKEGYNIQADGIFGPKTEQAVREYQQSQGLIADGIVESNTSNALALNTSVENYSLVNTSTRDSGEGEQQPNHSVEVQQASTLESNIVSTAKSVLGTPYVWGGTTAAGLDSSGFINYVFAQNGVSLSRTHAEMWVNDGKEVESLTIGDVLFYEGTYNTNGASHSGIYIGNNQMIHAGAAGVEKADITNPYWQSHFIGIKSFK
ncbi:C40 family peptidase [Shouchella shacheensis]|uniref:C40 family peptidase n=1 Tax=Shouchella shacheensis TaxID=1649580 RepID=UPI00073FC4EE|nr:C40 family peptidase [Shouchella shacheensis]